MERTESTCRATVAAENAAPDVAAAIRALSDSDLLRLKALAQLWTRGMPAGFGWADVLHEAIARALAGSRKWPVGVPILAFLSGVMRSICDDHWRHEAREAEFIVRDGEIDRGQGDEVGAPNADPERVLTAAQALSDIHRLFAGDSAALKIIAGIADGLTAAEICQAYDMPEREYDTVRKRMRRALLRCGLDGSEW